MKVARGLLSHIRKNPGGIVIQVQGVPDREAATAALWKAVPEIAKLGTRYLSPVLPAGTGPFIMIDGADMPFEVLRTIPDVVARHLSEAGLEEATIAPGTTQGPLVDRGLVLQALPKAVVALLYPPPPERYGHFARIPREWFDTAATWVRTGLDPGADLMASVVSVQFPVAPEAVAELLAECQRAGVDKVNAVGGDLGKRIRGLCGGGFFTYVPSLAIGAGGPAASDAELVELVGQLSGFVRGLADQLGYGAVSVDPTFGNLAGGHGTEWSMYHGFPDSFPDLCDEVVLDAFPYQVLGPRHLERLGGLPEGARFLPGGRAELTIGEPGDWLFSESAIEARIARPWELIGPRRARPGIEEEARRLLAPGLATAPELSSLSRARHHRIGAPQPQRPTRGGASSAERMD